jgi:phosphoribosyl 1,2-cyclic phosphodiesterase
MTMTTPVSRRRPGKARWPQKPSALTVRFWGTRGSYTVADRHCARYGGNTACVEVRVGERLFIVDAGSGIIDLGTSVVRQGVKSVDILLSHLHHDHILGLGFFEPLFREGVTVTLHCGHLGGQSAEEALGFFFRPPLFPIPINEIAADLRYSGFKAGETLTFPDGIAVRTCPLNHPGGACGYRFDHRQRSVAYLSDMEHTADGPPKGLVNFVTGADLVIYDGMFTEEEYDHYRGWGHSTWNAGVALCREAGAKSLALFHHHPRRTDVDLDLIEAELSLALPGSFCAREQHSTTYATDAHVGMIES